MVEVMKQMVNGIQVVGKLKTKDLEYIKDDNGVDVIRGNVVVEVTKGDKINNIRLNVYTKAQTNAGKPNGFYKGFQTVESDYKDIDTYGRENADRVLVNGDISYNVYLDSNDNLRQNNRLRANRFTRVNDDPEHKEDEATGTVGVIVLGYKDQTDKDGVETGETLVKAINIGYNGRVNKLVDLQVASSMNMPDYVPEQTVFEISFDINNYVEVKKSTSESKGFGDFKNVAVKNSFTSNLEITGGSATAEVASYDFTEDQLKEAAKSLRLQVEEAKNNSASKRTENYVKHDAGFNNALDNIKKQSKPTQTKKPVEPKSEKKTENSTNPFDNNDAISGDDFPDAW